MLYIGVDLGTSAVKLLLMDGEGRIQQNCIQKNIRCISRIRAGQSRSRRTGMSRPWHGIEGTDCREQIRVEIAGISFGGQMHGLVILDEQDQVIRPAILWNDGRTYEEM